MVDEVGEDEVVEHGLLLPLLPGPAQLLHLALGLPPQLPHLALDIKLERFLTKVGVNDFSRRLEANCGVEPGWQVWAEYFIISSLLSIKHKVKP